MTKRIAETSSREPERVSEVAAILADGYLRLIRKRQPKPPETTNLGQNCPPNPPPEPLDSSGHQSDEYETG